MRNWIFLNPTGTSFRHRDLNPIQRLMEPGSTILPSFILKRGCYAKTIDLSEEKEPEIFHSIRPGALVENVTFFAGTNKIDFSSKKITENTRVSYPLDFISNALEPSVGNTPKNIFFLT